MLPNVPSDPGALHPLVVHFPVALLLVAPLFLLMGAISKNDRPQLRSCVLVLMALGVLAAWVAVWTGEHAATIARITAPQAASVIEQHEESAEATAVIFTLLFAVFAIRVAVDYFRKVIPRQNGLDYVMESVWPGVLFVAMVGVGSFLTAGVSAASVALVIRCVPCGQAADFPTPRSASSWSCLCSAFRVTGCVFARLRRQKR